MSKEEIDDLIKNKDLNLIKQFSCISDYKESERQEKVQVERKLAALKEKQDREAAAARNAAARNAAAKASEERKKKEEEDRLAKEKEEEEKEAAIKIQAISRGKIARQQVQDKEEAAIKIQSVQRGRKAKEEFQKDKGAITTIQAIQRGNLARKEALKQKLKKEQQEYEKVLKTTKENIKNADLTKMLGELEKAMKENNNYEKNYDAKEIVQKFFNTKSETIVYVTEMYIKVLKELDKMYDTDALKKFQKKFSEILTWTDNLGLDVNVLNELIPDKMIKKVPDLTSWKRNPIPTVNLEESENFISDFFVYWIPWFKLENERIKIVIPELLNIFNKIIDNSDEDKDGEISFLEITQAFNKEMDLDFLKDQEIKTGGKDTKFKDEIRDGLEGETIDGYLKTISEIQTSGFKKYQDLLIAIKKKIVEIFLQLSGNEEKIEKTLEPKTFENHYGEKVFEKLDKNDDDKIVMEECVEMYDNYLKKIEKLKNCKFYQKVEEKISEDKYLDKYSEIASYRTLESERCYIGRHLAVEYKFYIYNHDHDIKDNKYRTEYYKDGN